MWPFNKREPKRYVILVMYNRDLCIRKATYTQAGWMANWAGNDRTCWAGNDRTWSILNPDGTTTGTSLVKRWYKHSGWPVEEEQTKEN